MRKNNIYIFFLYNFIFINILCVAIFFTFVFYNVIIPITIIDESKIVIQKLQTLYNIEYKLAQSIYKVSKYYEFDPLLIAELIKSESNFKSHTRSPKGYVGILQTPITTGYTEVDIKLGVAILKEKMKIHSSDLTKAIAAYKGGANKHIAIMQANQILKNYNYYKKKERSD